MVKGWGVCPSAGCQRGRAGVRNAAFISLRVPQRRSLHTESQVSGASAQILVPVLPWHTAPTHMSVVCEEAPLTHTMRMFATRIALLELVLSDKKQQDALLAMTICLAITVPLRGAAACSSSATEPRKVVGARSALLISASQNAWRAARADRGCFCTPQKNPAYAASLIVLD